VVPTGGAIRSISGDDFVQSIETDVLIESGDDVIHWQGQGTGGAAPDLTSVWEAQVVTVEAANAGAYGNGNAAEVTAPAGESRKRMTVIDDFESFAQTRVYYDLAIDVLPAAGDDVFMIGHRITGAAGSENGYIVVWNGNLGNNVSVYRLNNGTELLLATESAGPRIVADTAYVAAVEIINLGDDRVEIRTAIWDAKLEIEGPNWDTVLLDNNVSSIKTAGQCGFAAPDTVAVQLRSAVKGPVCIDMWGVTDVDFQSQDGVTIVAQTLRTDVSGAYGFLEIQTPDFTGLSAGALTVRATDPASNYFRDFTLGAPPVIRGGGGGQLPEATRDADNTVNTTQTGGSSGGGQGGGGSASINVPPQAGGPFNVTMSIEGYDFGSDTFYTIISATAITAGGQNRRIVVMPGVQDVVNVSVNDGLPYIWRVSMDHGDSVAVRYSVDFKHL
jgi:hypothetical protein